jgi:diguanylate cyclase (GGDEF)-like protein
MNRSGLLVRLAIVIIFAAMALVFLAAQLFYRWTYINQVELAEKDLNQLVATVTSTASIAAYLGNDEIAHEVITGLMSNDIVLAASIESEILPEQKTLPNTHTLERFPLHSPFDKKQVVGFIVVAPNLEYSENLAADLAINNVKVLIALAIIMTLTTITIAWTLITKPIIGIAKSLSLVEPGSQNRLKTPMFHSQSELGTLVVDVNGLLNRVENQFQAERTLREDIESLERRFRMLFENSVSAIILIDPIGGILQFNSAFQDLLQKLNTPFRKNLGPLLNTLFVDPDSLQKKVEASISINEIATGEFELARDGKHNLWVQVIISPILSDDLKEYYQITLSDISSRRRELDQLNIRAKFDPLTKLSNRQDAESVIERAIKQEQYFALVFIDLNTFKPINDIYGHDAGDEILVHIALQIKRTLRKGDFACRWGGDEFLLLINESTFADINKVGNKIIDSIGKPYHLKEANQEVSVSASLGVAFFPDSGDNLKAIVSAADKAMYFAKNNPERDGGSAISFADTT